MGTSAHLYRMAKYLRHWWLLFAHKVLLLFELIAVLTVWGVSRVHMW